MELESYNKSIGQHLLRTYCMNMYEILHSDGPSSRAVPRHFDLLIQIVIVDPELDPYFLHFNPYLPNGLLDFQLQYLKTFVLSRATFHTVTAKISDVCMRTL